MKCTGAGKTLPPGPHLLILSFFFSPTYALVQILPAWHSRKNGLFGTLLVAKG